MAAAVGLLDSGTVPDGIGTLGLTPIHLFPVTASSTVRLDGASIHPGLCMGLHTLAISEAIITSGRATTPDTHPADLDSRDALETAFTADVVASRDEAVLAPFAVADLELHVEAEASVVAGSVVAEVAGSVVAEGAVDTGSQELGSRAIRSQDCSVLTEKESGNSTMSSPVLRSQFG